MLRQREGSRWIDRSMRTSTERKVPFSSCGMERKEMVQTRGQTELGSHPAFAQGLPTTASEHPLSDSVSLDKLPNLGGPPCSHSKWVCKDTLLRELM